MANFADVQIGGMEPDPSQGGIKRKPLPTMPTMDPTELTAIGEPNIGELGNRETPRDRTTDKGPGTTTAPVPQGEYGKVGMPGVARNAPSMPSAPTPAAMEPFAPMAPPQGVQRKSVLSAPAPTSGMLGRAGGLLNGGLGLAKSTQPMAPDVSALIQALMQQKG
jgi:hypothetical protein